MTIRQLRGDCRDVLKTLPSESVHCVVTSPPYWGLRDYGVAGQLGLEADFNAYIAEMVAVFREVRRVLRSDGTLWLNMGDSYNTGTTAQSKPSKQTNVGYWQKADKLGRPRIAWDSLKPKDLCGIPWRVAFALQADGWWLRQDIIWSKPNPMPESVTDRCTKAHEYIFLMSKNARYYYDAEAIKEDREGNTHSRGTKRSPPIESAGIGHKDWCKYMTKDDELVSRNKRSVWEVTTAPFSEAHFATFPPALIEPCIKAGTSEKGCCAKCGAPWVRETQQVDTGKRQKMADGWDTGAGGHSTIHRDGRQKGEAGVPVMVSETIGWSPSCSCNADAVPCTVLDPFGGAGTTGLVADRLQRNAILIELNPEYAAMAERRIDEDAGMFAQVAAE